MVRLLGQRHLGQKSGHTKGAEGGGGLRAAAHVRSLNDVVSCRSFTDGAGDACTESSFERTDLSSAPDDRALAIELGAAAARLRGSSSDSTDAEGRRAALLAVIRALTSACCGRRPCSWTHRQMQGQGVDSVHAAEVNVGSGFYTIIDQTEHVSEQSANAEGAAKHPRAHSRPALTLL